MTQFVLQISQWMLQFNSNKEMDTAFKFEQGSWEILNAKQYILIQITTVSNLQLFLTLFILSIDLFHELYYWIFAFDKSTIQLQ